MSYKHAFNNIFKYIIQPLAMYTIPLLLLTNHTQALFPMGLNNTYEDLIEYGKKFGGVRRYYPFLLEQLTSLSACSAVKIGEISKNDIVKRDMDVYLTAAHCFDIDNQEVEEWPRPSYEFILHPRYKQIIFEVLTPTGEKRLIVNNSLRQYELTIEKTRMVGPEFEIKYGPDLAIFFTSRTHLPMYPLYQGKANNLNGHLATMVGYGRRYHVEPAVSLLLENEQPKQAAELKIRDPTSSMNHFYHTYIPIYSPTKPYARLTGGDSGGPLVWKNPQGSYEVIGINHGASEIDLSELHKAYFPLEEEEETSIAEHTCDVPQGFMSQSMLWKQINLLAHQTEFPTFHEFCATAATTCLYEEYKDHLYLCYGTTDEWEPIDMDFIRPILEQFNVTTP